jgi:hypothetical protein
MMKRGPMEFEQRKAVYQSIQVVKRSEQAIKKQSVRHELTLSRYSKSYKIIQHYKTYLRLMLKQFGMMT